MEFLAGCAGFLLLLIFFAAVILGIPVLVLTLKDRNAHLRLGNRSMGSYHAFLWVVTVLAGFITISELASHFALNLIAGAGAATLGLGVLALRQKSQPAIETEERIKQLEAEMTNQSLSSDTLNQQNQSTQVAKEMPLWKRICILVAISLFVPAAFLLRFAIEAAFGHWNPVEFWMTIIGTTFVNVTLIVGGTLVSSYSQRRLLADSRKRLADRDAPRH